MGFKKEGYIWVPTRREIIKSAAVGLAALAAPRITLAAIAFGVQTGAQGDFNLSSTMDTSGTNLLIITAIGSHNPPVAASSFSDSKGNVWQNAVIDGFFFTNTYYVPNPIVGPSHNVSIVDSGGVMSGGCIFMAFTGADTVAPLDTTTHAVASNSGANLTVGPYTPSTNGQLLISNYNGGVNTFVSQSGLAVLAGTQGPNSGFRLQGTAYEIQTTATARSSTWNNTGSDNNIATIISFKPAGASSTPIRHRVTQGGM